jgi:hypothetical protein
VEVTTYSRLRPILAYSRAALAGGDGEAEGIIMAVSAINASARKKDSSSPQSTT